MSRLIFTAIPKPGPARHLQGINLEYGDQRLHFAPSAVGTGKVMFPELFMSSVNKLLENFDDDDHRVLFQVYQTVSEINSMPHITTHEIFTIEEILDKLFDIITLTRIQAWGRDNQGYAVASSLDSISPMNNGAVSHSCTREEYLDICILSTLLKLLIPFQTLVSHIDSYLTNPIVEYWGLFGMINASGGIEEYPAYQDLIAKTAAKSESILGKGVPTGLTARGIGEEDYYRIVLIPKLFRDITRLETEVEKFPDGTNNNLTFKVNLSIENRIKTKIRAEYQYKTTLGQGSDDQDGNDTRQERKAGGERISSIYGIFFAKDYDDFINVINGSENFPDHLKSEESEIMDLVKKYPRTMKVSSVQDTISGALFDEVIPIDMMQHRSTNAALVMTAYSALVLKKMKLPNLHTMMMCTEDIEGRFTESETRNASVTMKLTHPLTEKVMELYPTEGKGNPLVMATDQIATATSRTNHVIAVDHDEHVLGEEWYPVMINDRGIKDEICEMVAVLNEVI